MEEYYFHLKKVDYADCDLIFNWANDDSVRLNSFNSNKIDYNDHVNWFRQKMDDPNCDMFLIMLSEVRVGLVRVDFQDGRGRINYLVDATYRGIGAGKFALSEIKKIYKKEYIFGEVKSTNIASIKAFQSADFKMTQLDRTLFFYFDGRGVYLSRKGVFIVAEISANHGNDIEIVKKTMKAAKEAGADGVKIQTYTPDTLTIDCDNEYFTINSNTIWDGRTLYDLYKEAYTPWGWHKELFSFAKSEGILLFSTPFDNSAVDFLESFNPEIYKVASFEITDIPLIKYIASKSKPVLISTGIATEKEIEEAIEACYEVGNRDVTILKCTSEYPATYEEMNLKTIPDIVSKFGVKVGLSDHSLGSTVAIAAVALGAEVIEKHIILDRSIGGPDSSFSMEISEFKEMVNNIRNTEKALGTVNYDLSEKTVKNRAFARSLFFVKDMEVEEEITQSNVRSIRPGYGLSPKYIYDIIGKKVNTKIKRGTPVNWNFIKSEE